MRIVLDLDGVICEETKPYAQAKPIDGARQKIWDWWYSGHTIIINTARHNSDRKLTLKWLRDHEIKYHRLIMGKPKADVYIDDKAREFTSWECIRLRTLG